MVWWWESVVSLSPSECTWLLNKWFVKLNMSKVPGLNNRDMTFLAENTLRLSMRGDISYKYTGQDTSFNTCAYHRIGDKQVVIWQCCPLSNLHTFSTRQFAQNNTVNRLYCVTINHREKCVDESNKTRNFPLDSTFRTNNDKYRLLSSLTITTMIYCNILFRASIEQICGK